MASKSAAKLLLLAEEVEDGSLADKLFEIAKEFDKEISLLKEKNNVDDNGSKQREHSQSIVGWSLSLTQKDLLDGDDTVETKNENRIENENLKEKEIESKNIENSDIWDLWYSIYEAIKAESESTRVKQILRDNINKNNNDLSYLNSLINYQSATYNGWTLLMFASQIGDYNTCKILLNYNADINIKDNKGRSAIDHAIDQGHWHVRQLLQFASMGGRMREKVREKMESIEDQRATIDQFLQTLGSLKNDENSKKGKGKTKGNHNLDSIVNTLIVCINKKLPISCDVLNLAWAYECDTLQRQPLKTKLWQAIEHTCQSILEFPINKRDWLWFKQYLLKSRIWFQSISREESKEDKGERLLFDELVQLAHSKSSENRDILQPLFTNIKSKSLREKNDSNDSSAFYQMLNIGDRAQDIAKYKFNITRQDCVSKVEKNDLSNVINELPHPIFPEFSYNALMAITVNDEDFNIDHYYEIHSYLAKMIVIANGLNSKFQNCVKTIFNINDKNNRNLYNDILYQEAPIKTLERCQQKAETEYFHAAWPTAAKLLDMIRASVTFKSIESMMDGIKLFVNSLEKNSNDENFFIKKIVRIKNGFSAHSAFDIDNPGYADIKFNVIVSDSQQYSMIAEIQFLLEPMLAMKCRNHELYEIERQKDFIENVSHMLLLNKDKKRRLFAAATLGDVSRMSELIITHNINLLDLNFGVDSNTGDTVLHVAATKGHVKMVKLIIATLKSYCDCDKLSKNNQDIVKLVRRPSWREMEEERKKEFNNEPIEKQCQSFMNHFNNEDASALYIAATNGNIDIVNELCHKTDFSWMNVNQTDGYGYTVLHEIASQNLYQILEILLKRTDLNLNVFSKYDLKTPLMYAIQRQSMECLKLLLNDERIDIEVKNVKGKSALSLAKGSSNGRILEMLEMKLANPNHEFVWNSDLMKNQSNDEAVNDESESKNTGSVLGSKAKNRFDYSPKISRSGLGFLVQCGIGYQGPA